MSTAGQTPSLRGRWLAAARVHVRHGRQRVREAAFPVLLAAVAAALSWTLASALLAQPFPFFAPAAAWISLGFAPDRDVRKVAELAIGVSLGVALGEWLAGTLGVGAWQIGLALAIAALLARFLDRGPLLTAQAGLQAVIIIGLPAVLAGGSLGRWLDALIGGGVALTAAVIVPGRSWVRARTLARASLDEVGGTLAVLAVALRTGEARRAADALGKARDAQSVLDRWHATVAIAQEATRFSPVARRHRHEVARLARAAYFADHAIRNVRVVSRRAIAALEDVDALPLVADLAARMAAAADAIAAALGSGSDPASAREDIRSLVGELQPERFDQGWRVQSLVVLFRSLLVDLLEITGMDHDEAKAEFAL